MQTQTLDFSDLGAKPVARPSQASGQLDFSDLGGKRVSTSSAAAAPKQSHWYTGVGDTLGREASSLGRNIAGIPGGVYHAFADDPTQEEIEEHGQEEVSGAKRVGLGLERLTARPLVTAMKWYRDTALGKIPDPVGQALDVAPEAMGAGGAAVLTPKIAESLPAAASATADAAGKTGARVVRGVAKGTNTVLAKAPGSIGAAAGAAVGSAIPVPGATTVGTGIGYALGKELLPNLRVPGEGFGLSKPPVYPGAPLPENPGEFPGAPLPERPPAEVLQAQPLATGGKPTPPSPAAALGRIPLREQMQTAPTKPLPDAFQEPYSPPSGTAGAPFTPDQSLLDQVRGRPSLTQQMSESAPPEGMAADEPSLKVQATKDYPRLIERVKGSPELTRPVTENPVVGDFVRAMQKSGMPIAKRPNLLLKGSGRVNRMLGPEEDLTDILAKSARWAKREQ